MASDYRAKFTKCPFYRREASARIVCEGIPPKSTSSTNFSDSAEKKEYKKHIVKGLGIYRGIMRITEPYKSGAYKEAPMVDIKSMIAGGSLAGVLSDGQDA